MHLLTNYTIIYIKEQQLTYDLYKIKFDTFLNIWYNLTRDVRVAQEEILFLCIKRKNIINLREKLNGKNIRMNNKPKSRLNL